MTIIFLSVAYARTPELAMIYDEPQKAISDAKRFQNISYWFVFYLKLQTNT